MVGRCCMLHVLIPSHCMWLIITPKTPYCNYPAKEGSTIKLSLCQCLAVDQVHRKCNFAVHVARAFIINEDEEFPDYSTLKLNMCPRFLSHWRAG